MKDNEITKTSSNPVLIYVCIPIWGKDYWSQFTNGFWRDLRRELDGLSECEQRYLASVIIYTDKYGLEIGAGLNAEADFEVTLIENPALQGDIGHKFNPMNVAHSHCNELLRENGGGILMPLCADPRMTKNYLKNALAYWQKNPSVIFASHSPQLSIAKFDNGVWEAADSKGQIREIIRCLDQRMLNRHLLSGNFDYSGHLYLYAGSKEEGYLVTGIYWHPIFIRVNNDGSKNTSQFNSQVDALSYRNPDITDTDIHFCLNTKIGMICSVGDNDAEVNLVENHYEATRFASWIPSFYSQESIEHRLSKHFVLSVDGYEPSSESSKQLNIAKKNIMSGLCLLKQDPNLAASHEYQRIHDTITAHLPKGTCSWSQYVQLRIEQIYREFEMVPVYLYGNGGHTRTLFYFTDIRNFLAGIVVQDESLIEGDEKIISERQFREVHRLENIVLIPSSFSHQNTIAARFENTTNITIARLYDDDVTLR